MKSSSLISPTFELRAPRRFEELESAFNGLFQYNPFAFALQHHARVYKDEDALIWLNGQGIQTVKLSYTQLELNVRKGSYCLLHKMGVQMGERVIL